MFRSRVDQITASAPSTELTLVFARFAPLFGLPAVALFLTHFTSPGVHPPSHTVLPSGKIKNQISSRKGTPQRAHFISSGTFEGVLTPIASAIAPRQCLTGNATKSSVFKTASMPQLNGCSCSAAGLHIRKGFVDKAAGVPQLICNLTDRAALRSQSGNPSGIHGHTWPA